MTSPINDADKINKDKAEKEEVRAGESAAVAFELYKTLGHTVFQFLHDKNVQKKLVDGTELNLTQRDFFAAILTFAATESLKLFDEKVKDKYIMRDTVTEIVREFRFQLEAQLKEATVNGVTVNTTQTH